jgi:hypothetical protein
MLGACLRHDVRGSGKHEQILPLTPTLSPQAGRGGSRLSAWSS